VGDSAQYDFGLLGHATPVLHIYADREVDPPMMEQDAALEAFYASEMLDVARLLLAAEPFDLKSKYRYWNSKGFGGELPSIPMKWVRSKRVGGYVSATVKYKSQIDRRLGTGEVTLKKLAVSNFLQMSEERFDEILLHEMIHVYVMGILGKAGRGGGHGAYFLTKRREVMGKTGVNIPMTEDISGLDLAEDVPDKDVGVLLAKKDGKTLMQVFNLNVLKRVYRNVADVMEKHGYYPWFAFIQSSERELQKYPEQRKYRRGWYKIPDSLVNDIMRGGRILQEVTV
jgi:hypothetical protein